LLFVSDVHGAFEKLTDVARTGEQLIILGDFVNLLDYRTGEGIVADVMGIAFAREAAMRRGTGDFSSMREQWREAVGSNAEEVRHLIDEKYLEQYQAAHQALSGSRGYATFGNVDRPDMMRTHLPSGWKFVDGEVVEIEGLRVGFVGGGVTTPLRAAGEVSEEEMAAKLDALGPVDVLCSHLPPAVRPLHIDVVTGRAERASQPILAYLRRYRPRWHFFGDVHQPQASQWRVGSTICRNVGYFRATGRGIRFEP
jgi:Icc-related predicted phosphoesterase